MSPATERGSQRKMGVWNRKEDGSSTTSPTKNEHSIAAAVAPEEGVISEEQSVELHRGLKARHITMIGRFLGYALGYGMF